MQEIKSLRLSVSKAKEFISCNKKYHFNYVLKLPKKERDYQVFGKFVHKVLEDFHQFYLDGSKEEYSDAMSRAYKIALAEYKDGMTKEAKKEAYDIIDAYLQLITNDKSLITNVSFVEKNFSVPISDKVILNGMIDRIQTDPDGIIHVCDYKTTKNKKYLKNDFLQLLTYAYIIYLDNPTVNKIRGSYILLKHNFEYITKDFSIEEVLKIKEKYEDYANQIEAEQLWRANPTQLCNWCEFQSLCAEGIGMMNKNIKFGKTSW